MTPKITWLLPVRNGMPFLPETLASIENQTYKDWEVLAWDNGSTDGTLELLQEWIPRRLPGKLVTGQPLSLGKCLAAMVERARSPLCARIDADDINYPNRLALQTEFLNLHPECAALGGQIELIDQHGKNLSPSTPTPSTHSDIVYAMVARSPLVHPSVLFRREAVLRAGNYRDLPDWGGVNCEDYDLWLRIAALFQLANLKSTVLKYRVHPNSSTEVSIRLNRLSKAGVVCFSQNAANLFGLNPSEAERLRSKTEAFALPSILKMARHLHKTQGLAPFQSPNFAKHVAMLVSPRDVVTRLALAWLRGSFRATALEFYYITRDFLSKLLRALNRKR